MEQMENFEPARRGLASARVGSSSRRDQKDDAKRKVHQRWIRNERAEQRSRRVRDHVRPPRGALRNIKLRNLDAEAEQAAHERGDQNRLPTRPIRSKKSAEHETERHEPEN